MAETAAHLQENVIGPHPVRQWVISFPKRIRHYLQTDAIETSVLRLFNRRGWFNDDEVEKILGYENTGFSLDEKVKIRSWDREGLERLIRYCARPAFASENLRWNGQWLNYRLPKPSLIKLPCLFPLHVVIDTITMVPSLPILP